MRAANILFIAVLLIPQASRSAEETIFRSGDEVVVRIPELDRLRQEHRQLKATVRLAGDGGLRTFALNLSDASVPPAIVVDVAGYGNCTGVLLEVQNEAGKLVYSRRVVPLPVIKITSVLPQQDRLAAIEPGTALRPVGSNTANQNNANAPKIPLPDFTRLRQEKLAVPQRSVTASEITYSVVTSMDLPVPASANYVIVSRQSFAPDDATACSLYFSYRKALYDEVSTRVTGYRKFLVEVPLDRAWLKQSGDAAVTLPLSAFAVHAADERSSEGTNMLGGSDTGLAQGGQSVDIDDQGRIYFSNVSDGAGLVRFNPHTQRFEQPPVNFDQECRKLIPAEGSWVRSWDTAVGELLCTRGRVYIAYSRNYRVHTPNGHFETCSGVVSVPQAHWDDAAAFAADIRLHAACWAGAEHRIYSDNVPVAEYSRKLVAPMATDRGIFLNTTPDCRGGPWRLDLDEHGNTQRLAEVKSLKDANSTDGAALPPAQLVTDRGLPKQRMINVGGAGRQFLKFAYGEFEISRAALALTLPGAPEEELVDQSGRFRTAYPGAPQGTLTVRFDVAAKIKAEFQRYPQLTAALSGISLGPNYCVTPIPGELDRAIGVCEYGYYFSKLDFSRRATERKVFKDFLPAQSGGEPTTLPTQVGLGPYNAAWVEHDDAQWLYIPGYTGIARLKYAEQGQTLKAFKPEMIHTRLLPQPIDGRGRDNVKDFLHVLPAIGGQLIDIGRGRPGRGGGAFSAGLELFDPRTLGKSQSAVYMNRCYGLYSPVSRLVPTRTMSPNSRTRRSR